MVLGIVAVLLVLVVALFFMFGGPGRISGTAAPSQTNINAPAQSAPSAPNVSAPQVNVPAPSAPQINVPGQVDVNVNRAPAQAPAAPSSGSGS
jgi:hypothetical protein